MDIAFNSSSESATVSVSIVARRNFVKVDLAWLSAVSVEIYFLLVIFSNYTETLNMRHFKL